MIHCLLGGLAGFLAYDIYTKKKEGKTSTITQELKDFKATGSPYYGWLTYSKRITELTIWGDEQGHPIVEKSPDSKGVFNMVSLESVVNQIKNTSLPSDSPMIVSLNIKTTSTTTINEICEIFCGLLGHNLSRERLGTGVSISSLKDKVILVSGNVEGTELDKCLGFSWNESNFRRLTTAQAVHSRDPSDLQEFIKSNIVMVVPDPTSGDASAIGCQWVMS